MKTLSIENAGLLELGALSLMGASTKLADDGKIGMFGTGNKYALSVFLREGYDVTIQSGSATITAFTKPETFRDQKFERVCFKVKEKGFRNSTVQETSITTQMGLQWKLEHALREFISNAKDEGGFSIKVLDSVPKKAPEGTRFLISGPASKMAFFEDYLKQFDHYYLFNRQPVYSSSNVNVYSKHMKEGTSVYRHGVLVFRDENLPSLFDYEFTDVSISELRVASSWECEWALGRHLFSLPKAFLDHVFANMRPESFEDSCDSYGHHDLAASYFAGKVLVTSDVARKHADKLFSKNLFLVTSANYKKFKSVKGVVTAHEFLTSVDLMEGVEVDFHNLTEFEQKSLTKGVEFIQLAGYTLSLDNIRVKDFVDATTYGCYSNDKVYIARRCLRLGLFEIVDTLLHEHFHGASKLYDATRSFEGFIMRELVSALQHKVGITL